MLIKLTLTLFVSTLLLTSCSTFWNKKAKIRVLHYNIKELDSKKLSAPKDQLQAVKKVLAGHDYNVISINEIQYDLPNVPNQKYTSKGKNLNKLLTFLDSNKENWNFSFHKANTGNLAKIKENGEYAQPGEKNSRDFADQLSFGLFPGQYSTGAATKFKVVAEKIITDLKWSDFNKRLKLNKYLTASGEKFPSTLQLFDKNFSDLTIEVDNKEVHLIFLHTVPAYHFGNKKSPNYQRNADQLKFLEWYLTGETDFPVQLKTIKPLPRNSYWIAMGDWNTDIKNKTNMGSKVLRRLFNKVNLWMKNPDETHESYGFGKKRWKATLDYIAHSNGLVLKAGGILRPKEERLFLGCDSTIPKQLGPTLPEHRKIIRYFDKKKAKNCFVSINKSFYISKNASDHFALWADFNFSK